MFGNEYLNITDMSNVEYDFSDNTIIVYFSVMVILGTAAILFNFKKNDMKYNYAITVTFNAWSFFIAPLIYFTSIFSTLFEAIAETFVVAILLAIISVIGMALHMLLFAITLRLINNNKKEPEWLNLSFLWNLGILTGIPILYFMLSSM